MSTDGWLLLLPAAEVPRAWAERVLPLAVVQVGPAEAGDTVAPMLVADPGWLSPAERRLAEMLRAGWSTVRMAAALGVSARTVQRRVAALRRRVGVSSDVLLGTVLGPPAGRGP